MRSHLSEPPVIPNANVGEGTERSHSSHALGIRDAMCASRALRSASWRMASVSAAALRMTAASRFRASGRAAMMAFPDCELDHRCTPPLASVSPSRCSNIRTGERVHHG